MNVKRYSGRRWVSGNSHKSFESPERPTLLQLMYMCVCVCVFFHTYTVWEYIYLYKILNSPGLIQKISCGRGMASVDEIYSVVQPLFNVNFPLTINSLGNTAVTIPFLTFTIPWSPYSLINCNLPCWPLNLITM